MSGAAGKAETGRDIQEELRESAKIALDHPCLTNFLCELVRAYEKGCKDQADRVSELEREHQAIFERDRTIIADSVTKLRDELESRHWLTEGRGVYEWDDDRWHEEFRAAGKALLAALKPLEKIAGDLSNCPTLQAEVEKARNYTAELERERDAFKTLAKMVVTLGKPEYVECDDIGAKTAGWEVKKLALSDWKGMCVKAMRLLDPSDEPTKR